MDYKKKNCKNTNTWRVNNMLQWIIEGIKEEINQYIDMNENENTMTQNLN